MKNIPNFPKEGMTLRDWFAGQALTGLMSISNPELLTEGIAACAYMAADAMLEEREKNRD